MRLRRLVPGLLEIALSLKAVTGMLRLSPLRLKSPLGLLKRLLRPLLRLTPCRLIARSLLSFFPLLLHAGMKILILGWLGYLLTGLSQVQAAVSTELLSIIVLRPAPGTRLSLLHSIFLILVYHEAA